MARLEELKSGNIQRVRTLFYNENVNANKISSIRLWTRPELAKAAGLSMGGMENVLKVLMESGEILSAGEASSSGGRKARLYRLNPDYAHIGILLLSHPADAFAISAASLNLDGDEVLPDAITRHTAAPAFAQIERSAAELLRRDPHMKYLILSLPGIIADDGTIVECDFPALTGIHLAAELEVSLSIPVIIENDVNLAVEGYGRIHPDCSNLALLYQPLHDPAGSGILIHRNLLKGTNGFAGEIGRPDRKEQTILRETNPAHLLKMQLEILTSVIAPERIAWYCPAVSAQPELDDIPVLSRPALDRLTYMKELETLIRSGAESLGRKAIAHMSRLHL